MSRASGRGVVDTSVDPLWSAFCQSCWFILSPKCRLPPGCGFVLSFLLSFPVLFQCSSKLFYKASFTGCSPCPSFITYVDSDSDVLIFFIYSAFREKLLKQAAEEEKKQQAAEEKRKQQAAEEKRKQQAAEEKKKQQAAAQKKQEKILEAR